MRLSPLRQSHAGCRYSRTGDKGALDGDGFLKITGRIKDIFKTSGGKYIALPMALLPIAPLGHEARRHARGIGGGDDRIGKAGKGHAGSDVAHGLLALLLGDVMRQAR
jgi:hypothetical protein